MPVGRLRCSMQAASKPPMPRPAACAAHHPDDVADVAHLGAVLALAGEGASSSPSSRHRA